MLAVEAVGHNIITIEGLNDTAIQKAFLEKNAFQCGYCTPGFIMNCYALANIHPEADDKMIQEWLGSNICRCTGYEEIREAIKSVLVSLKMAMTGKSLEPIQNTPKPSKSTQFT